MLKRCNVQGLPVAWMARLQVAGFAFTMTHTSAACSNPMEQFRSVLQCVYEAPVIVACLAQQAHVLPKPHGWHMKPLCIASKPLSSTPIVLVTLSGL